MLPEASRDEQADALLIVDDGNAFEVFLCHEVVPAPPRALQVRRRKKERRHPAPLVQEGPDPRRVPAVAHEHVHVLGAEDDHHLPAEERVVAPRLHHRRGDGLEHALPLRAGRVVDHDVRVDGDDRHGAVGALQAALDVERRPRTRLFVLADAARELALVAEGAAIGVARLGAPDVLQDEPERPADGGVGPPALAEEVFLAVDLKRVSSGAVDDDELRDAVRRPLNARQVVYGVEDGVDGGHEDGHVFGLAARHGGVDGDLLYRGVAEQVGDAAAGLLGRPPRCLHHGRHPLFGGRDDRQSVPPASFHHVLEQFQG